MRRLAAKRKSGRKGEMIPPDGRSYDELPPEIAFNRMIDRSLADSDAGHTISHEEMGRRFEALP